MFAGPDKSDFIFKLKTNLTVTYIYIWSVWIDIVNWGDCQQAMGPEK